MCSSTGLSGLWRPISAGRRDVVMTAFGSDAEGEAIQTDRYLELLLAAHGARELHGSVREETGIGPGADPGLATAARLLERTLLRIHPSFRFEEALAGRLRSAAEALWPPGARDEDDLAPIPFRPRSVTTERLPPRRLLPIGALASGVSIAGAAVYAWRRRQRIA